MKIRNYILIFLIVYGFPFCGISQINHPSVFYSNRGAGKQWLLYENNNKALYQIISCEAFSHLEQRKKRIDSINTESEWKEYQNNMRRVLFTSENRFRKTPLNARITGTLKKPGFKVEKILFESHPGFYVTGCLFIPEKRQKPAPAIIYCSGHTDLSFRSDTYQRVILNLVDKGFIVFGFDPIGQGERIQYLNPETGKSGIGSSTKEHTFAGIQTLLTGISLSDYFIWDGVRTVDYLLTRPEIDPARIGITGRSGGGTQTAMIAAYDTRIFAAAPECYITSFKRLLQSIGPQDAEQNPLNAIKRGFDHPDFLHLRAPKPTLVITTTHDYFSQQGARESFAEAQKSFTAFNAAGKLEFAEDYGKHESTRNNRQQLYSFFQRVLNNPGDSTEKEITPFLPDELRVTKTGQIQSSLISKTTFDLNKSYFTKTPLNKKQLKDTIKTLAGICFDRKLTAAVYTGKYKMNEPDIDKYFIENQLNDYALPVYVIRNKKPNGKTLLWLVREGKTDLLTRQEMTGLLEKGFTIVSADLPGSGELADPNFTGDGFINGIPFNYTFGAHLVGKSIVGIQAEAIDLLIQFIQNDKKLQNHTIYTFAENESCQALLHYTVFKNPFQKIRLKNLPESNQSLIETKNYNPKQAYFVVPGSLTFYDISDLLSYIPKEKLEIE